MDDVGIPNLRRQGIIKLTVVADDAVELIELYQSDNLWKSLTISLVRFLCKRIHMLRRRLIIVGHVLE